MPLRQQDGSFAPTRAALFLGLAALAAPLGMQAACGGEVIGGGAGGAGSSNTSTSDGPSTGGPSTSGPSTSGPSTSGPSTTTVTSSTISAYATGPTTSTSSGSGYCDDSGNCGDLSTGCIGCALAGNCADDYDACMADADCVAFWDCATVCADQACFDQCVIDHPQGADIYNTLLVCVVCDECYNDCDGAASGCP